MIATADIYDQHGEELASCSTQFRDFGGRRAFTGVVETLSVDRDNQLVKEILNTPGAGKVLVVDGQRVGGRDHPRRGPRLGGVG